MLVHVCQWWSFRQRRKERSIYAPMHVKRITPCINLSYGFLNPSRSYVSTSYGYMFEAYLTTCSDKLQEATSLRSAVVGPLACIVVLWATGPNTVTLQFSRQITPHCSQLLQCLMKFLSNVSREHTIIACKAE